MTYMNPVCLPVSNSSGRLCPPAGTVSAELRRACLLFSSLLAAAAALVHWQHCRMIPSHGQGDPSPIPHQLTAPVAPTGLVSSSLLPTSRRGPSYVSSPAFPSSSRRQPRQVLRAPSSTCWPGGFQPSTPGQKETYRGFFLHPSLQEQQEARSLLSTSRSTSRVLTRQPENRPGKTLHSMFWRHSTPTPPRAVTSAFAGSTSGWSKKNTAGQNCTAWALETKLLLTLQLETSDYLLKYKMDFKAPS